jgi:hypothetical protein
MRTRVVHFLSVVSLLLAASGVPAAAQDTGIVEGAVYLEGEPLPDVEVWLGEGFDGVNAQNNRVACTDANGRFRFTNVPVGVPLTSATGPSLGPVPCANPDFVSPAGLQLRTLFFDGQHRGANIDTFQIAAGEARHLQYNVFHETDNIGMVDTSTGRWHLRPHLGRYENPFFYGDPGDAPFTGDWDCDGVSTPGLYRQTDGFAYLRNSNSQGVADIRFFFGDPGDVPLAGDFNGDGCDTLSLYRPGTQEFFIINELGSDEGGLGAADFSFVFGNPGDKPFVGDFDGEGIDEVGLHRESTGFVYYRETLTTGVADNEFFFGDPGDRFVAGEFLLDTDGSVLGYDAPAVFRPSNTTWYFKRTNTQGVADFSLVYGESSWLPVGGFWAWPEVNPGDSKSCTDFITQPEAQGWHDFFFPFFGDVAKLDADGDGIACEGLPATTTG